MACSSTSHCVKRVASHLAILVRRACRLVPMDIRVVPQRLGKKIKYSRLENVIIMGGEERLPPQMITIDVAMRSHTTMPPDLRNEYAGFYCKRPRSKSCDKVEVHFVFGSVKITQCEGYVSYQAVHI